jgi:hypothetical protein
MTLEQLRNYGARENRQFQREPQCAGRHAKALQRRFECRSGAGSRLAQDPFGFDQPIWLKWVGR